MERHQPTSTHALIQWGHCSILYNVNRVQTVSREWFEPRFWALRGLIRRHFEGRGQALAVETPVGPVVLRCFQRGGWIARFVADRYLYLGQARSRAFREFVLLQALFKQGLPVPEPLLALCERSGLTYRAALITHEIAGAQTLADLAAELQREDWAELRASLDSFFAAGVRHPDLNAKNILRDRSGRWYLIDFDRARQGTSPADPRPMLRRLKRSLCSLGLPADASALGAE